MMIVNNISFETVDCSCCERDRNARVSSEIMNLINKHLDEDKLSTSHTRKYINLV
jgi:hypothetical protein